MSKKSIRKDCTRCNKSRFLERDFYMSNSYNHSDGRITVCKQCIGEELEANRASEYMEDWFIEKVKDILLDMNRPYIHEVWESSVEESKRRNWSIFGVYMKNISLNHKDKNWRDSVFKSDIIEREEKKEEERAKKEVEEKVSQALRKENEQNKELNERNKKDVLRLLKYDPFQNEVGEDKAGLYNKLIDYLTEDVLEDGFRLSSVISIVRTFHQIDRIDAAIANSNPSEAGNLIQSKERLHKTALNIAKENGISIGASARNSAGSGTLTGIMKQLSDYDFHEAEVNLFDIEAAEGISQVAEISMSNIMKQLQFDENDYTVMLREQRDMIKNFQDRAEKAEEDLRLLRVELDKRNKLEEEMKEELQELKLKLKEVSSDE